jgi:hypothetical protein
MQDLKEIQTAELLQIATESIAYFQKAIQEKGLVFEDALRTNFESFIGTNSTFIAAEIHFLGYGRFKDMKTLHWSDAPPPIDSMIEFVKKTGVDKFAWVPGYEKSGKVPAETIAIKRLARAIQYSFVNSISKKKYEGTWYASTKGRMVNVARRRILEVTALYSAQFIAQKIGSNVD